MGRVVESGGQVAIQGSIAPLPGGRNAADLNA